MKVSPFLGWGWILFLVLIIALSAARRNWFEAYEENFLYPSFFKVWKIA